MPAPTVYNPATSMLVHATAIADPAGGVTVDAQARPATVSILAVLRDIGAVAGATALNVGHVWTAATRVALGPDIAAPTGGVTIDAQVRAAINSILSVLRSNGILAGTLDYPALILDEDTGAWSTTAIANPSGGTPADAECRTAINAALAAIRSAGLIAQD